MNLKPYLFFIFVFYFVFLNGAENGYKYWKKANQLFEQKKYQEALIYYDKIDKNIDILDVKINSARCLYFLEKFVEGEIAYQKIIETPNINLDVYKEYANILIKNGKPNDAKIWEQKFIADSIKLQKFIAEIPKNPTKVDSSKTKVVSSKTDKVQKLKPIKEDSSKTKVVSSKNQVVNNKIDKEQKLKPIKDTVKIEKPKVISSKNQVVSDKKYKEQKDTTAKTIKTPKVKPNKDIVKIEKPKEISNKTKEVSNKNDKKQKDTTAKTIKTPKVKPTKVDSSKTKVVSNKIDKEQKLKPIKDTVKIEKPKEISNKTKVVSDKKDKKQKDTTAKIIKTPKVKPNKNTIKIEKLKVVIQKDTTSKVIKMPKVKADKIPALIYKIKLATVLVDPGAKNFENISSFGQITFTKIANQTIYYIGNYKSYLEAVKYLQKIITQGYSKAYITPFYLDKEISISEAIEKENK